MVECVQDALKVKLDGEDVVLTTLEEAGRVISGLIEQRNEARHIARAFHYDYVSRLAEIGGNACDLTRRMFAKMYPWMGY